MKFFLDSADVAQIEKAAEFGILDGVTTNPSLMAKVGVRGEAGVRAHYKTICEMVDGDVSAEVIAVDYAGMIAEADALAAIDPRIVVKIPMLPDGVRALKTLSDRGVRTNCTLVFSAAQALLAARAGASFISPFIGRIDDAGGEGFELVHQLCRIFDHYEFNSEVLSASIRSVLHVVQCAEAGSDIVTCPYAVFEAMFKHPLTDAGLERFLKDHEQNR